MKAQLLFFILAILACVVANNFVPNTALAQITITATEFQSQIGTKEVITTYSSSDSNELSALVAMSGANKIWDITGRAFAFQSSDTCSYFDSPMLTPAGDDSVFVDCNFVRCQTSSGSADTVFSYFHLDETNLIVNGSLTWMDGSYIRSVFTPPYCSMQLPLTFGSHWNNSTMVTIYTEYGPISQHYDDSVEVDGYGTVITPVGSFPCLRVKLKSASVGVVYSFYGGTNTYATITTFLNNTQTEVSYTENSILVSVPSVECPRVLTNYRLLQNYPNPFNPSTTIRYELPKASFVTLKLYNLLGQEVALLVNEKKEAGRYEVQFSANNLPSGVYFYCLQAGTFIGMEKLLLLK